jgi:hypothetical protein
MAIDQIAEYQVNARAVDKVKRAIEEFVRYVKENEPRTRMYVAWQQKKDPTQFAHFFIFEDEAAHKAPRPVGGGEEIRVGLLTRAEWREVVFTDYNLIASNEK